jgi:5-formyltetrahydrofolate cyclo-ligase
MTSKADLRADLLARRAAMSDEERAVAADAIAQHATSIPAITRARRVAVHLSMPSEPGTGPLVTDLLARGAEVLAPIALPEHTLDWAVVEPGAATTTAALGMAEPTGRRLGPDVLATCDLVVLPALAVDHAGRRLGRGAGYYDRALTGIDVPRCAIVFAHELLSEVPAEEHDEPVQMALTPQGLFRVP